MEIINMMPEELWKRAIATYFSTLMSDETKDQARRLFSMVTTVEMNGDKFNIFTKNEYAADLLTREYKNSLQNCLSLVLGNSAQVTAEFSVDKNAKLDIVIPANNESRETGKSKTGKISSFISTLPLNEEYTFDEFVQGPSNSWAYAAANGVVKHPGDVGYNPLFIHGGTGLGKTHLMQAIGNAMRKKNPMMSICYLTAETFLNEYVNSLQNNGINSFREKYRKVDVLLVDDVQFLQKGKQCQEEFFNTFNDLIGKRKQIVMTSDVAPKDLSILEQRLISRFEGGMVQEIESPSYETRLAILQKKAEGMNPSISDSSIKFIAEHIKSHVRAMEGALGKVKIMMMMDSSIELTEEMLTRLLKDFIEKEKTQKNVTIEEIQTAVANAYSVTLSQILSSDRTATIVTPRQLAMYITRKFTNKSLPEIAKKFEKTHATILHGVKTISKRLDVEQELKDTLEKIIDQFGYSLDDCID